MQKSEVTKEMIDSFLKGIDPQERIIKVEGNYTESQIHIVYRDEKGIMRVKHEDFYPFVWCKLSVCKSLFNGNRDLLVRKMNEYGIKVKLLRTANSEGYVPKRMDEGYKFMFYAIMPMSYNRFLKFFEEAGKPVYGGRVNEFVAISNTEQHMIRTGKRLFKGYEDYDDLIRMTWDLETEGLDPRVNAISQIGIYTNKGYQKIIEIEGEGEERKKNELKAISELFQTIHDINPDIITGHNTENFDWNFVDVRLDVLANTNMKDFTKSLFNGIGIYKQKKQSVLKLGGEMEYFFRTVCWGHNITDSLHAVRRAQALDSSMKKSNLKYVADYSKIKKDNRVYIQGKMIDTTWLDLEKVYAFNNDNGHWFKTTPEMFQKTFTDDNGEEKLRYTFIDYDSKLIDNKNGEEFEFVTGRYIANRYLMDDLWEGDRVEHRYNSTNFLLSGILPLSFEKVCTTGTAALWKYIMLGWSYQYDLAIPDLIPSRPFTGGLSRLLEVGFVDNVVKLDYNSLYPSIILTYGIHSEIDIMGAMSSILEYVLTQREHYKGLKAKFKKMAEEEKKRLKTLQEGTPEYHECQNKITEYLSASNSNDKQQIILKVLGNSFFGGYGSGNSSGFYWSDIECAEETTCRGRQSLRLMISHFTNLGYKPIVGDSFTGDTPMFIKYNDTNKIDIKTIQELIDESSIQTDLLGREYDYSAKPYKVLCRSGWCEPNYIYRHKTDKDIIRVYDENSLIDVTEDHSLFNDKQEKIKPSQITSETKLEYYKNGDIFHDFNTETIEKTWSVNNLEITTDILNATIEQKQEWWICYRLSSIRNKEWGTKKYQAKLQFIRNCLVANGMRTMI